MLLLRVLCALRGENSSSFRFSGAVDGAHAGHGFVDGLLVFALGGGIGDDAAAAEQAGFAVLEQDLSLLHI